MIRKIFSPAWKLFDHLAKELIRPLLFEMHRHFKLSVLLVVAIGN